MKKMNVIAFNSTHHAIKSEKLIKAAGMEMITLPTPREISASCGMSIMFEIENIDAIKKMLDENNVDYRGFFQIEKNEDGTRNLVEL